MNYSGNEEISPFMVVGGDETSGSIVPTLIGGLLILIVLYGIYIFMTAQGEWKTSEWSDCSVHCGGGTQTRSVTCDPSNCDPALKPLDQQPCGTDPCWTKTPAVGGSGGTAYDFKCPDGQYVNKVYYRAGAGLDQIGVRCSGSNVDSATSDLYGGTGGGPGSFEFVDGIDSFYVTGGRLVGNITPGTNAEADFTRGGAASVDFVKTATPTWKGDTKRLSCNSGYKIAGIYGNYGSLTDKLGFNCYKFAK